MLYLHVMVKSQKALILFVTGVSGSGKSTLMQELKLPKNKFELTEIDEHGVPIVGRGPWRAFRVEELLYKAINNTKTAKSTIIFGITKPHEVIESRQYTPDLNVHFLCLNITKPTLEKRLNKRLESIKQESLAHNIDWQTNFNDLVRENIKLSKILHNSTLNQKNGHIFEVDSWSKTKLSDEATKLINKITP